MRPPRHRRRCAEHAATCGRSAMEGGDERASVKRLYPFELQPRAPGSNDGNGDALAATRRPEAGLHDRFVSHSTAFVAGNDAPRFGECAAMRGRVARDCGDARAGVKPGHSFVRPPTERPRRTTRPRDAHAPPITHSSASVARNDAPLLGSRAAMGAAPRKVARSTAGTLTRSRPLDRLNCVHQNRARQTPAAVAPAHVPRSIARGARRDQGCARWAMIAFVAGSGASLIDERTTIRGRSALF